MSGCSGGLGGAQATLAASSSHGTHADDGNKKSWHGHMTFIDLDGGRARVSCRTALKLGQGEKEGRTIVHPCVA